MWNELLTALVRLIERLSGYVAAFYAGRASKGGENARQEFEKAGDANKAVGRKRGWSLARRLQWLRERGLLRDDKTDSSER